MAKIKINQNMKFINVHQVNNNVEHAEYNNGVSNSRGQEKEQVTPQAAESHESPIVTREISPIREQILLYVSCLIGQVNEQWISRYEKLWQGILDLDIVASKIYDPGKQQRTTFNRNLVANIIHYLGNQELDENRIYKDYNAAQLTEKLEGDKDHSVRAALGQDPAPDMKKRLDSYLETFKL